MTISFSFHILDVQAVAPAEYERKEHLDMGFESEINVKGVAESELRSIARTSFSSDGFTEEQIDAISSAIEASIIAYDEQKKN